MKSKTFFAVASAMGLTAILFSCQHQTSDEQQSKEQDSKKQQTQEKVDYRARTEQITGAAQKTLFANVQAAMKEGGPSNAVEFCNLRAMPLTDSLSQEYKAYIERISFRNRNPGNIAKSTLDSTALRKLKDGEKYFEGKYQGSRIAYKPIYLKKEGCLKCHGEPGKDINARTMAVLKERYPNDHAKNYTLNDFRGAWKITYQEL